MLPLIELIRVSPERLDYPANAVLLPVTGITADSRQVEPGDLYAALKGARFDGTQFITQAEQAGAMVVLCDTEAQFDASGIAVVRSDNPRRVLAHMAARMYYGQPECMVAVTGTDGKTSTCDFYRQFWHHMGQNSASIGTLGVLSGNGEMLMPGSYTTPTPVELHKLLADLYDRGIDFAAIEASSQGLDQYRMDGVRIEAAAFTNIARDHLDYHKTEEAYFAAKLRLFSELLPPGETAVLNQDDDMFPLLLDVCQRHGHEIIGFGKHGGQFRVIAIEAQPHGQRAQVELFSKPYMLEVPLVGAFQVMNILAALGLVIGVAGDLEQALAVIPKLSGVPGRLEQVARLANGATVFIDYAHTPAALANILTTLRPHTQGKLHVIFGCGGDRDPGKRLEMGRIADRLADEIFVTDDNPRSEDPKEIRKAIISACPRAKEVADRRLAIYVALKQLGPGDILVIAGKGHEKTQIIGDKTTPFDDAEVTRQVMKELKLA